MGILRPEQATWSNYWGRFCC